VTLNQTAAEPLTFAAHVKIGRVATLSACFLAAEGTYTDGQAFPRVEKSLPLRELDWKRAELRIEPQKPLRSVTLYLVRYQDKEAPKAEPSQLWSDDASLTDPSGRDWLKNGGFEEDIRLPLAIPRDGRGRPPPGWRWRYAERGYHSLTVDRTEAKEGTSSLRLDLPYPVDQVTGSFSQDLDLQAVRSGSMRLSLWAKGLFMGRGGGMVQVILSSGSGKKWSAWTSWKAGADWTRTELRVPLQSRPKSARLAIYFNRLIGMVWFDDVRLEEEALELPDVEDATPEADDAAEEEGEARGTARNYIINGSFEERVERKLRRGVPLREYVPPFPSLPETSPRDEARGFLVSSRHYLHLSHPKLVPEAEDLTDEVSLFASPGEYEPVTFSVTALRELRDLKVRVTDLQNDDGAAIGKENLDVRAVTYHPMYQHHVSRLLSAPDVWYVQQPHLLERLPAYSIPSGETRQFWITAYAPPEARAGVYCGKVHLDLGNRQSTEIGLKLRGLPIDLKKPPAIFGMYLNNLRGYDGWGLPGQFKKILTDMREHGMNCWPLMYTGGFLPRRESEDEPWGWTRVEESLAIYREIGFTAPLIIGPLYHRKKKYTDMPFDALRALRDRTKEKGWSEVALYVRDEPHGGGSRGVVEGIKLIREFWPEVKTFIAGGSRHYHARMDDGGFALRAPFVDWPCPGDVDQQVLDDHKGRALFMYNAGSTGRDALNDRYYFGYHAWRCGLDGVFQFTYNVGGASPYKTLKCGIFLYAYPSPGGGVIPTVAWEGVREGIDDWRYLHTLEETIREARRLSGAATLAERAASFLKELRASVQPNFTRREERYIALQRSMFQARRWQAAQWIVRLRQALGAGQEGEGGDGPSLPARKEEPRAAATDGAASPALCCLSPDGYITTWLICGPFPNYEGEEPRDRLLKDGERWGFHHDFLADLGGEPKAAPVGGRQLAGEHGKKVVWRAWFSDTRPVILNHATGVGRNSYQWKARHKVGYAYCVIVSPKKQKAFLKLGHGRGAKIWLNGQQVYGRMKWTYLKSDHGLDREIAEIELQAGDNPCLAKVDKTDWEWAFGFRIVSEDDKPLAGLRVKLPVKGGGLRVLCREALRVATVKAAYPAGSRPTLHIRMPRMGYPVAEGKLGASVHLRDASGGEAWQGEVEGFSVRDLPGSGVRRRLGLEKVPPGDYRGVVTFFVQQAERIARREFPLLLYAP